MIQYWLGVPCTMTLLYRSTRGHRGCEHITKGGKGMTDGWRNMQSGCTVTTKANIKVCIWMSMCIY